MISLAGPITVVLSPNRELRMTDPANITFSERPSTGRLRFKLRTLSNWTGCIGVFITLVVIYAWLLPEAAAWIADFVTGVILYFTLFSVLQKRTIWILCNHCKGRIATNRPWVCGDCNWENRDVDDFPFINRCGNCRAIPRAYECHHCLGIVFLSDDPDERNYACALGSPSRKKPAKTGERPEDEETTRKRKIRDYEDLILKAKLETDLVHAEANLKKARGEKMPLEEEAKLRHEQDMKRFSIYRDGRAKAEQFKNDPERYEREKEFWENWKDDMSI